jgi:putative Mg2+ transporter-C (MgtC) family protein
MNRKREIAMPIPPEVADTAYKLLMATVLGGVLGLERERKRRAAGLRTHIVVCLGATLAVILSNRLAAEWMLSHPTIPMDRGRIIAGILQGIGFIGAGAIIHVGNIQHGLTTAAMVWFVAVLGIAIGLGFSVIAICATTFALAAVMLLEPISDWLSGSSNYVLQVRIPGGEDRVKGIKRFIEERKCIVDPTRVSVNSVDETVEMQFQIGIPRKAAIENLVEELRNAYADIQVLTVEK